MLTGAAIMLLSLAAMIAAILSGAAGFAVYVGPLFGFMLGFGITSPSVYAGVLAPFPTIAGSVSSLMGVFQFVSGAVMGTVAVALVDPAGLNLGLPDGGADFACRTRDGVRRRAGAETAGSAGRRLTSCGCSATAR